MKINKLLIIVLIVFLIATVCVGCNNKGSENNQGESVSPPYGVVYDQEIAEEKFLKERISDATSIYYKSSVDGQFGDDRYLFEKTLLPAEYTELDYIQSTGAQSIDTGIRYADTLEFDLKFSDYTNAAGTGGIFGTEGWMFSLSRYASPTRLIWCTEQTKYYFYNSFSPYKTYVVQCGKDYFTINDIKTISIVGSGIYGAQNITLFKSINGYSNVKLYYFKIKNNGVIVRNYIPCYRNYDNAVGLYDLVTGRFYCNSSEYNFKYETNKNGYGRLPNGYQEVEYIESTGHQYLDTKYSNANGFYAEVDFTLTGVPAGNCGYVIGCHNLDEPWGRNGFSAYYGRWEFGHGDYCPNGGASMDNTRYNAVINTKKGGAYLRINGNAVLTDNSSTELSANSVWLFTDQYYWDRIGGTQLMKLYGCKIYDINEITMVRNFIPCIRNSDNKPGLYDFITNSFYGNSGEGEFLHGEPIETEGTPINLPKAYQQVEYIESSGTQYIDTGIIFNSTKEYLFKAKLTFTTTAPENQIFGFTGNQGCGIGTANASWWECDGSLVSLDTLYNVEWFRGKTSYYRTINGTKYSGSGVPVEIPDDETMLLFAAWTTHNNPTITYYCSSKLYGATIYENNNIVRDYIPCYRKSDNKPGLFDLETNTFYANSGTGEFEYGNPIYSDDDTILPKEYQQLEYIESDGSQIIDTGFVPKFSNGFDFYVEYSLSSLGDRYSLLSNYNEPKAISLEVLGDLGRIWIDDATVDRQVGDNTLGKNSALVKFKNNTYTLTCNGSSIDGTYNATADSSASLYIFNDRISRTDVFNHEIRLYSCKLYNGNTLERDFIPALRKSDQAPGLYDLVNNVFYMNIGTGSFVPGNPVYSKSIDIIVPSEYQSVEYIESSGAQKITLDVIPQSTYKIESTFTITDLSKISTIWCSRGNTTTDHTITAFYLTSGLRGDYGPTQNTLGMINDKSKYTLTMDKNSWYLNGDLIKSGENDVFEGGNKLQLFASYYDGLNQHVTNYSNMKLYLFKVYNERGQIVLYLIPCYRVSDNVAGLYDVVSGAFYTNSGTGVFNVGDPIYAIPSEYQQIEYIQTTGTQYINTGITTEAIWEYDIQYTKSELATRQLMGHSGSGGEYWGITDGYYGKATWSMSSVPAGNRDIYRVENYEGGGKVYINGVFAYNNSFDPNCVGKEVQLFALRGNFPNYCKLYGCKVYDKDGFTLLRDYVPAIRYLDNVAGLYDKVTSTFFINNGTGDFAVGGYVPTHNDSELPNEYQEIDYIQSTISNTGAASQGQQIDTGIKFDAENDWMEITFQSTTLDQNGMIFGNKQASNYFWLYHYNMGGTLAVYIGQNGEQIRRGAVDNDLQEHHFMWKNKQSILDGVVLDTETRTLGITDDNMFLFSWGGQYHYQGKIFSCKIWKAGVLVREFVPCYRKVDGEVGMFDIVNNVFYTNTGTGSFMAGSSSTPFVPGSNVSTEDYDDSYSSVKYLTSTGEQYIDTELVPTSNVAFEVVFGTDNVVAPNGYVLGNGPDSGLEIYLDNGDWVIVFGTETATINAIPSTKTTIALANKTLFASWNDSQLTPVKVFTNTFESTRSLTLFATNRESGLVLSQGINIYGFRMASGLSMCEYKPSVSLEDNAYGMYDTVTKELFESSGAPFLSELDVKQTMLPNGYHVLEYVQGTGTQYIDTGIHDSNNTMFEIDSLTTTGTSEIGSNSGMNVSHSTAYPGGYFYYLNHSGIKGKSTTNKRTLFKMNNNICYKDDAYVDSFTAITKTDTYTMFLFGRNHQGTLNDAGDSKIYSCKIYESKLLVRYYIPACRDEDGEIGLYELVTGTFCVNQGEGKFFSNETGNAYDGVVLPNGYRQVEYVEGTGTQYFDTGLVIEKEDSILYESKFQYTSTAKLWSGSNPYLQYTYEYFKTKEVISFKIVYDGITEKIYVGDYLTTTLDWTNYTYLHSKFGILRLGEKNNTWYPAGAQPGKVYSAKLTKNDEVVLDCVPCYRESDGVAGLFDLVSQTFLGNVGTGDVVYGPEVKVVTDEYEAVDYIEYTGTQKIEIPYEVTSSTKVELSISSNTSGNNTFPLFNTDNIALNVANSSVVYTPYDATINGDAFNLNTRYTILTSLNPEKALIMNGIVYDAENITLGTYGDKITLFGNATSLNGTVKIYRIRIFEGNVLLRDLIPCSRKYDGKIGLFGSVNNLFYPSLVDDFECNVSFEASKFVNLYDTIDYLYLDAEHYLNLSYIGNTKFIFDAQFDKDLSNGVIGYSKYRDNNWGTKNGKYVFGGEGEYAIGNRDIITEEFSTTAIVRTLNGEVVANIPLSKKMRGNYCIGSMVDDYIDNCAVKIYNLKVEQNGILVAHLVPAIRKSDQSIGFIDKVTNAFYCVYSNKNNFIMGNIVGHHFDETRVITEVSESQNGDIVHVCSICGAEIHEHESAHAYKVEFTHGTGIKEIKVFKGYDLSESETTDIAYTRNENTNNFSRTNGQVFFEIMFEEGYSIDKIYTDDGAYSNIEENIYKITSIASDITVKILAQKN